MRDDAGMRRPAQLTRSGAVLRGALVAIAAAAAATGAVVAVPSPATAAPVVRWVDVSVATLWSEPRAARPVDAPALANPADPGRWVASMSDAQKRWLSRGNTQTQVLYGTRVQVSYGPLLDIFMLDMRSYRGPNGEGLEESYGPATYFRK